MELPFDELVALVDRLRLSPEQRTGVLGREGMTELLVEFGVPAALITDAIPDAFLLAVVDSFHRTGLTELAKAALVGTTANVVLLRREKSRRSRRPDAERNRKILADREAGRTLGEIVRECETTPDAVKGVLSRAKKAATPPIMVIEMDPALLARSDL